MLDLRRSSPTYGRSAAVELSAQNRCLLFLPSGFAHGFLSLEAGSTMLYQTSSVHAPESDAGIHWAGFGFAWPAGVPVTSARDESFPPLAGFESPFFA
jgi:dTDP-4-dehydrorhamnose 3,5-epimerase